MTERRTFSAVVRAEDEGGLHVRVCARLIHRLREEAPEAKVRLRNLSGGIEVSLATIGLRATGILNAVTVPVLRGDLLRVEARGSGAERAVEVVREVLAERWVPHDYEDYCEWISPGGFLFELADERTIEQKLEDAEEELSLDPHDEELQRRVEEARRELEEWQEACRREYEEGRGPGGKS